MPDKKLIKAKRPIRYLQISIWYLTLSGAMN